MARFSDKEQAGALIESQLYAAYSAIGKELHLPMGQLTNTVSWIQTRDIPWPRSVFGQPTDHIITEVKAKINNGEMPFNWIMRRTPASVLLEQEFENNGFRKVMEWPGMMHNLEGMAKVETRRSVKLLSKTELKNWLQVVNPILFKRTPIALSFFVELYESKLDFNFYGLIEKEEIVSTALTFENEEYMTIFMVATLPEYRNRGFSSEVIKKILQDAKARNCRALMLQASPMSRSLYANLGFQTFCHFDIYWLLGHR